MEHTMLPGETSANRRMAVTLTIICFALLAGMAIEPQIEQYNRNELMRFGAPHGHPNYLADQFGSLATFFWAGIAMALAALLVGYVITVRFDYLAYWPTYACIPAAFLGEFLEWKLRLIHGINITLP